MEKAATLKLVRTHFTQSDIDRLKELGRSKDPPVSVAYMVTKATRAAYLNGKKK